MTVFAWGAWVLAVLVGLLFAMFREAPEGYARVSLGRLLFFVWMVACVPALAALRMHVPALLTLVGAAVLAFFTFLPSSDAVDLRRDLEGRLAGARNALAENPGNTLSLELLGDLYSTLEDAELAREHWDKVMAVRPDAKLVEKLAALERRPPVFFVWGRAAARDWRACRSCGGVQPRLAQACADCGVFFYPTTLDWALANADRIAEDSGLESLLKAGVLLLPFLVVLGPLPYALVLGAWALAFRRPGEPSARPPGARLRRLALWSAGLLAGAALGARLPGIARARAQFPVSSAARAFMP